MDCSWPTRKPQGYEPGPSRLPFPNSTRYRRSVPTSRAPPYVDLSTHRITRSNTCLQMKHVGAVLHWRPRTLAQLAKCLVGATLAVGFCMWWIWELHVEIAVYSRSWVQQEIMTTDSLGGCFDHSRISPKYNITRGFGPKRTEIQAGLPLRLGMDCYDFAGTIAAPTPRYLDSGVEEVGGGERLNYHTYWRTDLAPFEERQEWSIKSFFATQDLSTARLILWSNGNLKQNKYIQKWLRRYPEAFDVRIVDIEGLAKGTALEGSDLLHSKDKKAWIDGDLIRLLVIWTYGGLWVDMDSLLTRDLSPLVEHEFMTQWDCYGQCSIIFF